MAQEQIHELLDGIYKGFDEVKNMIENVRKDSSLSAAEAQNAIKEIKKQGEVLAIHEDRLRQLDRELPKGEKIYRAITEASGTAQREARDEFGKLLIDIATFKASGQARFNCDSFKRAQVEGVAGDGGYTVPPEQRREVINIAERYGVARRVLRVLPMNSNVLRNVTNADLPAVFWDSEVGGETLATLGQSKVTFDRPEATAHRLIALDTISMDLNADADISGGLVDYLIERFGIAIAKEEDYQAFVSPGTGNEPFTGLLYVNGITEVQGTGAEDSFAEMLLAANAAGYDYLVDLQNAADEDAAENGMWLFSNSILNLIRKIKDSNNLPMYHELAAGAPGTLLGRPYVRSRVMPKTSDGTQADTPFMLYGNFKFHIMGDREMLQIGISEHAAWNTAGLVMRVTERVAFKNAMTAPFSRMRTAA